MTRRNPLSQQNSEAAHTAFGKIAEACEMAHSAMLDMSRIRPDQRDLWLRAAANMKVMQGQMYDLATQGAFTAEDGKYGGGPTNH